MTAGQKRAFGAHWPQFGVDFAPTPLDLSALFGRREAPLIVEIGFGSGDHLLQLASARPHADCLGIEVHPPGIGRLFLAAAAAGLRNVRASCHDAVEVFEQQIPPARIDDLYLLFPDPWPKKRHHKRRIVQPDFVALVASRLKPGGTFRLATDWAPYAEHMLDVLGACRALENTAEDGRYIPRPESRAATRFESRGTRLGHGVWDLTFKRRCP